MDFADDFAVEGGGVVLVEQSTAFDEREPQLAKRRRIVQSRPP